MENAESAMGLVEDPVRPQLKSAIKDLMLYEAVKGVAIIRRDGALIESNISPSLDLRQVALSGAALANTAEMCSNEMQRGEFEQVICDCDAGSIVCVGAGQDSVLACVVDDKGGLGSLLIVIGKAAEKVSKILA
ncbi:MAG: roadblock/LC7 domain-containing protein [Candidatus Micrarchaeia archaeon]